jgi:hypothetical protein
MTRDASRVDGHEVGLDVLIIYPDSGRVAATALRWDTTATSDSGTSFTTIAWSRS